MSGDAQPRKRKDKRRKKDELTEELLTPTKEPSDEVIHKHKTAELGGNIITKLVFFALLGGLVFMVGLILVEYRGSTDEETMPAVDSQWSLILDDWIEKGADLEHHDEHALHEEDHDEHGDEEDHDHGGGEEEHEAHEEHDEHDEHEEHTEEEGPGWFSSLYEAYTEQKEEGGGGWLSFGKSEEPEQKEEAEPEPEKSSGSWFSFGSTDETPPEPEEPVKEEDSEEPEKDTAEEPSIEDELIKDDSEDAWTLSNELLSVSGEQEDDLSPEKESIEKNESGPEEPEEVKEGDQKNDELTPSDDEDDIEDEPPQVVPPSSQGPQSVEDPVEEEVYFNADVTNDEDWTLKDDLDDADGELNNDGIYY